jgi:hypothetical protein
MKTMALGILPLALAAATVVAAPSPPTKVDDPLRFWEGRTESESTVKVLMHKPFRSHAVGRGRIRPDGSLDLVQRVEEDGKPAKERRWQIRQVGPGRYSGTMSEAKGPVTIEEVDGRFRFRFKMAGNLSVEQILTPQPGGRSAISRLTIKKLGMTVGRSEGTVRKIS